MSDDTTIFVNKDACKLQELFLNEDWCLMELCNHIYSIYVGKSRLKWLVKVYNDKKHTIRESDNLNLLKGLEGIPKLLAVGLSNDLNYIIISEAPGTDLYEYVKKNGPLPLDEIKDIAKKLFKILISIHRKKVIHKDIKPENIIYDPKSKDITLIDFEGKYTKDYQSPEQIKNRDITKKTDVWSAGMTLYYLATADLPFDSEKEILNDSVTFEKGWDSEFKDFLWSLLDKDVEYRYSPREALNHVWMTG